MNKLERRSVSVLAGIIALRMFGLFLMIPIIALYADSLPGATPLLVGLALGVYGLTQACFQIPFGLASDRIGRKPLITLGLLIFAVGSLAAAFVHSIWGLLLGRALQGAGAISSVIMALAADLTSTEQRTKAMAMIGMTIGLAFMAAFIAAPWLQSVLGVSGMFILTAVFALLALLALWRFLPNAHQQQHDSSVKLRDLGVVIKDKQLWRLDLSVACLHGILAMTFVALPFVLHQSLGISKQDQAWVYVPMLLLSFLVMLPLVIIAEKHKKNKIIFQVAISLLLLALSLFWFMPNSYYGILLALWLFFSGFNVLEASLPSWVSKVAPKAYKGTALGVYATSQFLGFFLGGVLSGFLLQHNDAASVFAAGVGLSVLWLVLSMDLKQPQVLSES